MRIELYEMVKKEETERSYNIGVIAGWLFDTEGEQIAAKEEYLTMRLCSPSIKCLPTIGSGFEWTMRSEFWNGVLVGQKEKKIWQSLNLAK